MDQSFLLEQLEKKIEDAESLMSCLSDVKNVGGIEKLKKKIKQEINFLVKVRCCLL